MATGTINNPQKRQTLSSTALTNKISDVDGFSAIVIGNFLYISGFLQITTQLSSNENVFAIGTGSGVRVAGNPFVIGATGTATALFQIVNDEQNDRMIMKVYWDAGKVNYWNFSSLVPVTIV